MASEVERATRAVGMLKELSKEWDVHLDGWVEDDMRKWSFQIFDQETGARLTYWGDSMEGVISRAWAGESPDSKE